MIATKGTLPETTPIYYPLEIIGIYPTAKAALLKRFCLPQKRVSEILRKARASALTNIILQADHDADLLFGAAKARGQWLAVHGRSSVGFGSMAAAMEYADDANRQLSAEGKERTSWLFVRHTKPSKIVH